jgi:hypothetical protein
MTTCVVDAAGGSDPISATELPPSLLGACRLLGAFTVVTAAAIAWMATSTASTIASPWVPAGLGLLSGVSTLWSP